MPPVCVKAFGHVHLKSSRGKRMLATVSAGIAPPTRCNDVLLNVPAALTSRHQMFRGALEVHRLTYRKPMLSSECGHVGEPHGVLAVTASSVLLFECMGAPRPKVGHAEDPPLG